MPRHALRTWTDETTGREIRLLTDFPSGASLPYFRYPKHLPDGRMLLHGHHAAGHWYVVDPESGALEPLPIEGYRFLRLCPETGLCWQLGQERQILRMQLPSCAAEEIGRIPADLPGHPETISCDGRFVALRFSNHDVEELNLPRTRDAAALWRYLRRPRRGSIGAYDLATGEHRILVEFENVAPAHLDASPRDPTLLRYAEDHWDGHGQRAWAVRLDGSSKPWPIRPQAWCEVITHEFWWSDGEHIGFTYQDRRGDPTIEDLPWCEYSPRPTRLGIADTAGRQRYLSDPVNHYHTHLYCSRNGRLVSGSGTDGHSFVYAARFDWNSPRVDYVPLATIHTPYIPFRGQGVNCDFSADGKWLLYSDTVDGKHQLCAVAVDL